MVAAKIAFVPAFFITALLLLMQQGTDAGLDIYLNCFKVGAFVFGVIFIPAFFVIGR